MAKKVRETSAEDRLAAALVPANEQPYQVPENWVWTTVTSLSSIVSKGTTPQGGKKAYFDSGIGFLRVENIGDDGCINHKSIKYISDDAHTGVLKRSILCEQDVLISIAGTLGKTAIVRSIDLPLNTNQAICFIRLNRNSANPIYVKYCLDNPIMQRFLLSQTKVTAIPNLTLEIVSNCPLPLPPLPEQHRIVERIESLFTKLDEAKDEAQAVIDGYEDRKAAILNDGVQGILTAPWRNEKGYSKSDWKKAKLSDVCQLQTGLMKGKHFQKETILMPYLRVANVQDGFLNLEEIKEIEVESYNYQRYMLNDGDVLFTEGGDFDKLGRGTVWHCEIPRCLHQNHVFVVRTSEDILLPDYLSFQAGSLYGKRYFLSCSKQTTNLASINSSQLKNFPLIIPPLAEQQEIVRRINRAMELEQQIKSEAEETIANIATLKQSILARAFRGELGTNDTADEPAIELLKRTLKQP